MLNDKYFTVFLCGILLSVKSANAGSVYELNVEDHEGNEVSLKKYEGMVTLIVNVASQCGYTEATYRALTRLHDILSYGGYFSVLAFPCNQFGEQEPDDAPEILTAVQQNFGVEFPIFNKIDVVGSSGSPLFKNLIEQSAMVPDWNFYKYLVNWKGEVEKSWGTTTTIEEIFNDIQAAIEDAKQAKEEKAQSSEKSEEENKIDQKEEL